MKFCCASNAAIKNVKIARKKINFFSKIFSTKSLLTYLFMSNNKAMNQQFQHRVEFTKKILRSCPLYILRPSYGQIMTPNQKKIFATRC